MSNATSSTVVYNLSVEVNRSIIYINPIIIALVVLTNTINIATLCRRTLRTSSCSHYFITLAIASLIYMCFTPLNMYLGIRFGKAINYSPFGCRILYFLTFSSGLFFTIMLVCASFDRFCASSASARMRRFSTMHIAQRVIIIISILLAIYMSPFILIYHWDYNINQCSQYSTTLIDVYLSTRVVLYYIIAPLAMITFGLLTIRNIRNQTRRVVPMAQQNPHRHRRTEGQLARVLIIQVGIHLFFSLPIAAMYVVITYLPGANTPFFIALRSIAILWQQAVFFLSFFSYILSSTVFRTELLKMLVLNNPHNRIVESFTRVRRRVLIHNMADTRV